MARIYNRDNINYSGLIGQAIQNANQTSQLYANKWQPGSTMGQALGQAGEKLQQAGWNEWSAQQNDARARAKLAAEQNFQAQQNQANRDLQWAINQENNANALKIAQMNKATQAEYKMDEYHKGLSNAIRRRDEALRLRDMANEGSPEWHAANTAAGEANTEVAYYNSRINKTGAIDNLNKALESGDILEIAKARAALGQLYPDQEVDVPYEESNKSKKEDQTPPSGEQGSEGSSAQNPPTGVSWPEIGESQIAHLPKQFKTDADIEKAKSDAATIKDGNVRQKVVDAIDNIADKGTIEGNRAARAKKLSDANAEYKKTGVNPNPSLFKVSTDANGEWILTWK